MATLREVAKRAGVDVSTASRVLRSDPAQAVRPVTRERILDVAESLGYRPNASARSLRTRRTNTIGFIVPDLDNIGFAAIARGVQQAAAECGYLVLLVEAKALEPDIDLRDRLMRERRVDGLLVAHAGVDDTTVTELQECALPMVATWLTPESGPRVVISGAGKDGGSERGEDVTQDGSVDRSFQPSWPSGSRRHLRGGR